MSEQLSPLSLIWYVVEPVRCFYASSDLAQWLCQRLCATNASTGKETLPFRSLQADACPTGEEKVAHWIFSNWEKKMEPAWISLFLSYKEREHVFYLNVLYYIRIPHSTWKFCCNSLLKFFWVHVFLLLLVVRFWLEGDFLASHGTISLLDWFRNAVFSLGWIFGLIGVFWVFYPWLHYVFSSCIFPWRVFFLLYLHNN